MQIFQKPVPWLLKNNNRQNQFFWATKNEHPKQTIFFFLTRTAGQQLVLSQDSLPPRPENGPEPRREKGEPLSFPSRAQAHPQGGARGSSGTGPVSNLLQVIVI